MNQEQKPSMTVQEAARKYEESTTEDNNRPRWENRESDFIAGADWQAAKEGWIDVNDELPEVGEIIDTWNGISNRRARLVGDQRQFERYVDPIDTKGQPYERRYVAYYPDITHWRKLPAPPESNTIG